MIIYFSGTGNCEYTAKAIAKQTNDKAISITKLTNQITLNLGENLGIITPTYYWRLPSYVEEFLSNIKIINAENSYIYYISTYGTTCGQTDYFINKLLKKQHLKLSASFGIKTVDNWTVLFDLNDKNYIEKTLKNESLQINQIIDKITNKAEEFIKQNKKPLWLCKGAKRYYDKARKTIHLNVNNQCINCGLCERKCPEKAIKIINQKPTWIKPECTMCFRCLHNCPMFAIHYDNKTQSHGQYTHPR